MGKCPMKFLCTKTWRAHKCDQPDSHRKTGVNNQNEETHTKGHNKDNNIKDIEGQTKNQIEGKKYKKKQIEKQKEIINDITIQIDQQKEFIKDILEQTEFLKKDKKEKKN